MRSRSFATRRRRDAESDHLTDARSITTTIAYDALNRPTSKSYNDSPQTPTVNFYYDSQSLPTGAPSFDRGYSTGALVAVTYGGGSAGTYRGYDVLGRVVRQYQQTDSVNYLAEASYSVTALTSETYPSVPGASDRRTVSYSFDSAGRLSSLSSSATTYAAAASVASIGYASSNALKTEAYGNSLIHAVTYNNRLQPTEIKLGTSGNPTSVVDLTYSYGTTGNNGNVSSASYSGGGLSYTQSFTYDSLNRLSTAQENSGSSWSQTNAYDRYGNRWIDYGGGSYNLSFSTTTNRITTSGYSDDSSGNLLNDGNHAYTYNAENKIRTVDTVTAYTYDGEGKRVRKLVGENTRFIYGIGGQLIMEFDGSSGNLKKEYVYGGATLATIEPTSVNANGTRYTTGDNLGSPRVVTNSSGGVVSRHDYMPFGEELFAGTGGRTTGMGFSATEGLRKKFTGYERDTETGLDFAQARYYSNTQARFTSADPLMASASTGAPQSWNRYSYVGNNPLNATDPTGMAPQSAGYAYFGKGGEAMVALYNQESVYDGTESWERDTTPQKPTPTPCDRKFGETFGGQNAVGRTAYDYDGQYRGYDPAAEARVAGNPRTGLGNPLFDAEHLYWFPHLSGNQAGTANTDVYVPGNYVRGSVTQPTQGDAVVTVYYKNFFGLKNVTLAAFHIADFGPERAGNRLRIGTTGGPGGNESATRPGSPNLHSHFELWRGRGYRPPGPGRDAARIPLTPVICR